ncbi:RNA-binding cell elongation regulator Jag/EloR [Petrotoga sp. 9PWA.NaAc.5.4]|uniref:RNA-binding cell elongation regulator Jag/EloR n=1 Tax=Petrotoga sp. 9PWA.NaAc.5.4 TaxID=1434328 RepID=UPI000CC154A7|nr:RNA-binding cell elongation regulator Jag/EloR [Petrotoga sp. 9PWA.NaAc.5.4]PNR94632.1 single-stranded DNA-binding protein [Petrotoga sp. 9PWA.NaAc.5.4]
MLKVKQEKTFEADNLENALKKAVQEFEATSIEEITYTVVQEPSKGLFFGIGKKPIIIEAYPNEHYLSNKVKGFLSLILSYFDENVNVRIKCYNKNIIVYLEGDNLGKIIGKQGRNLAALQHLMMIFVNRMTDTKFEVKLDVGEYRRKRKKNLETIAEQAAEKVLKTNSKVELAPMFSFERRAIHEYIKKNYPKLITDSIGLEPYRKVVIYPSKNGTKV